MAGNTYPVVPALKYRDARQALDFLCRTFGFARHAVYEAEDGNIAHAELRHGDGFVMFGQVREGTSPMLSELGPSSIYVVVQDPDAHHEQAAREGAEVVAPLTDQDYGSREYAARDPEGNVWTFGTYAPKI